jgi:cytochrome c-type biogenesis protein
MANYWGGLLTAGWLGILTSVSPCPLATNIAAISYLGKNGSRFRDLLIAGLLYALGRLTAYMVVAALIVSSLLSISGLSVFLLQYMNELLGPVLIVAGMFLTDLFRIPSFGFSSSQRIKERFAGTRFSGAFLLGAVFALTFCPISAALFFGSLIPLATTLRSSLTLPGFYGLGTSLPVLTFAVMIAMGAKSLGAVFQRVTAIEVWGRRVTGTIFIVIGTYLSWTNLIA